MSSKTTGELSVSVDYIKEAVDELRQDFKTTAKNVEAVVIQTTKTNGRVNGLEAREEDQINAMTKLADVLLRLSLTSENHSASMKTIKWVIGILAIIIMPLFVYFAGLYADNVRSDVNLKIQTLSTNMTSEIIHNANLCKIENPN